MQHCFTLTLSADYQQSKLIPSWGRTEQPGSTYYLQKVSHDIFGIIDHREEQGVVYLFDERIGPKNTDHTVSSCHPWIKRLALFLDNATSTNKNKFMFAWAMELVSTGTINHIHISFMLAGHTKFAPDHLFATIGSAYKSSDIFTISELQVHKRHRPSLKMVRKCWHGERALERSIQISQECGSFTTSSSFEHTMVRL